MTLPLVATDPDGDALTYTVTGLPPGLVFNPGTHVITGDPVVAGSYAVSATATDPAGLTSTQTFTWTITTTPLANPHAPVLTPPGDQSTLIATTSYPAIVLASNPAGYWRLENDGQPTATDWAVTPVAAAINGGVTRGVAGALADGSTGMAFDGIDGSHLDITNDPALDLTTTVSVEAWVNIRSQSDNGGVFDRLTGSGEAYLLMKQNGIWIFRVNGCSSTEATVPVAATDVGAWVYFVGTFDGTTARLYKNGALVAATAVSCPGQFTMPTGGGVTRIGERGMDNWYPFAGAIDEVAVYGGVLSDAEVAAHYAARTTPSAVNLALHATDADGDALTYTATGLPRGLLLDAATGAIAGSPLTVGSYPVTVAVTDPAGLTATASFNWIVLPPAPLNPPIASPGAGAIAPGHAVSLTAPAGATIYYTVDGSEPTANSPIYGTPIVIGSPTTIKAFAVEAGFPSSALMSAAYTIDSTPPTITGSLYPVANAAGWNSTPVTATFICGDDIAVAICPDPIVFSNDGANQQLTATATDLAGNSTSLTVIVNPIRTQYQEETNKASRPCSRVVRDSLPRDRKLRSVSTTCRFGSSQRISTAGLSRNLVIRRVQTRLAWPQLQIRAF